MNFGQGCVGFTFWPMAKSKPDPEYSTLLSDPIVFVALSITVFASCANALHANNVARPNVETSLLTMLILPCVGAVYDRPFLRSQRHFGVTRKTGGHRPPLHLRQRECHDGISGDRCDVLFPVLALIRQRICI